MKSKDWSAIASIVVIASIFSLVLSSQLIGSKKLGKLYVEKSPPITDAFPLPNSKYFNSSSINPTKQIKIGEDSNTNPFQNN